MYGCFATLAWCALCHLSFLGSSFPIGADDDATSAAYYNDIQQSESLCTSGYIYIPLAFLAMLYVVYLVECWHCFSKTAMLAHAEFQVCVETSVSVKFSVEEEESNSLKKLLKPNIQQTVVSTAAVGV